jgi:hypothetical protein
LMKQKLGPLPTPTKEDAREIRAARMAALKATRSRGFTRRARKRKS